MLECSSTISRVNLSAEMRMSLHQRGEEEAQRFKWIESEKAGRDLGETAIRTWIGQHWNGFLRHRWLEHLQGKTFWIELDPGDFGLLADRLSGITADRSDPRTFQARARESRRDPLGDGIIACR